MSDLNQSSPSNAISENEDGADDTSSDTSFLSDASTCPSLTAEEWDEIRAKHLEVGFSRVMPELKKLESEMEQKKEHMQKLIRAINGARQVLFYVHLPIPRITFYKQPPINGPSKFTIEVAKLVFPYCDSLTRFSLAAVNREFKCNFMNWVDVTKLCMTSSPMIVDENTTTILRSLIATSDAKALQTYLTTHFQNLTTLVFDGSAIGSDFACKDQVYHPTDILNWNCFPNLDTLILRRLPPNAFKYNFSLHYLLFWLRKLRVLHVDSVEGFFLSPHLDPNRIPPLEELNLTTQFEYVESFRWLMLNANQTLRRLRFDAIGLLDGDQQNDLLSTFRKQTSRRACFGPMTMLVFFPLMPSIRRLYFRTLDSDFSSISEYAPDDFVLLFEVQWLFCQPLTVQCGLPRLDALSLPFIVGNVTLIIDTNGGRLERETAIFYDSCHYTYEQFLLRLGLKHPSIEDVVGPPAISLPCNENKNVELESTRVFWDHELETAKANLQKFKQQKRLYEQLTEALSASRALLHFTHLPTPRQLKMSSQIEAFEKFPLEIMLAFHQRCDAKTRVVFSQASRQFHRYFSSWIDVRHLFVCRLTPIWHRHSTFVSRNYLISTDVTSVGTFRVNSLVNLSSKFPRLRSLIIDGLSEDVDQVAQMPRIEFHEIGQFDWLNYAFVYEPMSLNIDCWLSDLLELPRLCVLDYQNGLFGTLAEIRAPLKEVRVCLNDVTVEQVFHFCLGISQSIKKLWFDFKKLPTGQNDTMVEEYIQHLCAMPHLEEFMYPTLYSDLRDLSDFAHYFPSMFSLRRIVVDTLNANEVAKICAFAPDDFEIVVLRSFRIRDESVPVYLSESHVTERWRVEYLVILARMWENIQRPISICLGLHINTTATGTKQIGPIVLKANQFDINLGGHTDESVTLKRFDPRLRFVDDDEVYNRRSFINHYNIMEPEIDQVPFYQ
ncbi:hypothetical protein M3Y98_00659200 [Aphelenchoides besseyi]|nr:hypothetical protein M3Y98_00659200 [Aphelenchoides besseyi]